MPLGIHAFGALRNHAPKAYGVPVESQQSPTTFNQRVGANLQRLRKAAWWSQADLADQLAARGLPFGQPTVLKVEKGARPLKLEEACAIAETLGVSLAALSQYVDNEQAAEAVAQIQRSNLTIAGGIRAIEDQHKRIEELHQLMERFRAVKRDAEQRLRDAGGHQDDEGRWWWQGKPLPLDATVTPATIAAVATVPGPTKEPDDGQR
jgi:transcriptional regulator with XRE-family HTH domain